jgi:hypothetical protein
MYPDSFHVGRFPYQGSWQLTRNKDGFTLIEQGFCRNYNALHTSEKRCIAFLESKMSKKLILGLALASVLVGGSFIGAKADDIGRSCWAGFCPAQQSDMDRAPQRDYDKPNATCQGADQYGPTTPEPMGSPGY